MKEADSGQINDILFDKSNSLSIKSSEGRLSGEQIGTNLQSITLLYPSVEVIFELDKTNTMLIKLNL